MIEYIYFIVMYLFFYYNFHFISKNNISCIEGISLYETNEEIKKNLLSIYNNDIYKIKRFIYIYFKNISKNIDEDSRASIESQKNIILDSLKCNKLIKHLTKTQIFNHELFLKELPIYKRKYTLDYYTEEVFYYHHGLRFSNKK